MPKEQLRCCTCGFPVQAREAWTLPNWRLCQLQKEETDRLRSQTTGLIGAMDCFSEGIMLVNTDSENWNILFVNDAWSRVTGEHAGPCGIVCSALSSAGCMRCTNPFLICWMVAYSSCSGVNR